MCSQESGRECAMTLAVHLLNSRSTTGKRLAPTNSRVSILAAQTSNRVGRSSIASPVRVLIGIGVRFGPRGLKSAAKQARCIPLLKRLLATSPQILHTTILRFYVQVSGGRPGMCPSARQHGFCDPVHLSPIQVCGHLPLRHIQEQDRGVKQPK